MKRVLLSAITLSLLITQSLRAQVILQDSFNYANGFLTNVSANLWTNYSGTLDSQVNNGRAEVFGTRAADFWRPFTNTPASTIYASFTVNATNTVNNTNYFAHFSQNSSTFNARTFAVGNAGGPVNTWRLGITAAAGAGPSVQIFPLDLATNVDYRVIISYDTVARLGTLWVDPVDASDPSKLTTDSTSASAPLFFSFRQSGTASVTAPNLRVDDLYVGNSFADVNVSAAKPPVIYYQPPAGPTTNFTGGNLNLSCVAGGSGAVTFQWQHEGTNLVDDANNTGTTSNILSLVNTVTSQSGAYKCIVTSITNSVFAGSVTSSVAQVVVSAAPVPPSFTSQPVSQTAYKGQNVIFSTSVSSPGNVSFTWYSNNVVVTDGVNSSGNTSTLELDNVQTNSSASYKVAVTNDVVVNGIVSSNAVLTVLNPPAVTIAFLRSLIDPVTLTTTASPTQPYQATGIITSFTNTTTGNTASYYLQDATAGINIFATFGQTFRPQEGDVVTFIGVLSSFTAATGGLELFADTQNRPYTSYSIVSNNFPLPASRVIPFDVTNVYGYLYVNTNLMASLVTLTNVYFGTNAGTVLSTNNTAITVTNISGQPFTLQFYGLDQDTANQTLPTFATSVTGNLIGFHPNVFLAVTKFSDIVTNSVVTPIPLNISLSGGILTFTWSDASFNLQSATNVAGPYATIPGAASGFTTNTASAQMYFRLFHP